MQQSLVLGPCVDDRPEHGHCTAAVHASASASAAENPIVIGVLGRGHKRSHRDCLRAARLNALPRHRIEQLDAPCRT